MTDAQWQAIEPYCLGKRGYPGQTGGDGRLFLEAVLWIVRTGSLWRDLPKEFGCWNSVFKRFRRWVQRGAFERIFQILSEDEDADFESVMVDGTIVRVHRHGQGAKGGPKISRSVHYSTVVVMPRGRLLHHGISVWQSSPANCFLLLRAIWATQAHLACG